MLPLMMQLKLLTLLALAVCAFSAPFGWNHAKTYMGLELQNTARNILPHLIYQQIVQNNFADEPEEMAIGTFGSLEMMQQMMLGLTVQTPEVRKGVRRVTLSKDGNGKLGLRIMAINKGIYVTHVTPGSPADFAGIKFGEHILDIEDKSLAGYRSNEVKTMLKEGPQRIELVVRERPMERSITLQKDSLGHVGFIFKDGKITKIVKDSSAARNGLLIEHNMLEINGQSVVGLKDKEISKLLTKSDRSVTVTIIPSFMYDHIVKSFGFFTSHRTASDV